MHQVGFIYKIGTVNTPPKMSTGFILVNFIFFWYAAMEQTRRNEMKK